MTHTYARVREVPDPEKPEGPAKIVVERLGHRRS